MRRNLLLAEEFASAPPAPATLLITGSREIARFPLPRGVDLLSLPALYKDSSSQYHSRTLGLALPELIELRSSIIMGAIEAFDPDVFVVDNVPRGAVRELEPVLTRLRQRERARCVLGLRDILDDPTHVRAEWNRAGNIAAIRQYYDAVWVYGDQDVLDVAREYGFPADVRRRIQYVGYLDQRRRGHAAPAPRPRESGDPVSPRPGESGDAASLTVSPSSRPLVVGLLGGGQDGLPLARAFITAEFPAEWEAVLVTGPMMSPGVRAVVDGLAAAHPSVRVVEFVDDPAALMRSASAVITMGGYNTVCDVLSWDVRALIVPRVVPRTEQLIRAKRLAERGLLEVLHPEALTPAALLAWVTTPVPAPPRSPVRLHDGAELRALLDSLCHSGHPMTREGVRHAS